MSKGFLGPEMPRIGKNPGNLNPPITSYKAAPNKKNHKKKTKKFSENYCPGLPVFLKQKYQMNTYF